MIESKAWNWKIVKGNEQDKWLEPSMESYYLLRRSDHVRRYLFRV